MKKGFTLIELLIASTIFIIVMMMATAIFSWASTYNAKLREMRNISQSIRKSTDMISKDIRLANGKRTVSRPGSTFEVGEISLYSCASVANSSCNPVAPVTWPTRLYLGDEGAPTDSWIDGLNANALLIIQHDRNKYILYRKVINTAGTDGNDFDLFRFEGDLVATIVLGAGPYAVGGDRLDPNLGWAMLNDSTISLNVGFAGYAVVKSLKTQQPYCEFAMRGQSIDYELMPANDRARSDTRTTAETRDYNYSF